MTVTSELERYCRRPSYLGFDATAFKAALQADWDAGEKELIYETDIDGRNGIIRREEFVGYVGIWDPQTKRPFIEFRSIKKNNGPTWRNVYGLAPDGRIVHVGKMRRATTWAKEHGYA